MKKPSTADMKRELMKLLLEYQQKVCDDFNSGQINEMEYLQKCIPIGMHDMINQAIDNAWSKVIP